ncbi:diguanylate cyclase [Fredinandcohnia humi]
MLTKIFLVLFGITVIIFICYKIKEVCNKLQLRINYFKTIVKLVENSKDIIYYIELKPIFKYIYLSPAIEKILSPSLVTESMKNPYTAFERIHPDDYHILVKKQLGELDFSKPIIQRWRNDEGTYITFEEYATPIYMDGEIVALQGIIRNINDKVLLQQKLEYKASHDSLTGLYNREYFEALIDNYDKIEDVSIGIIICDLDELKYVNDNFGHKLGDNLIKETAKLLKGFSCNNVIVSRIGGDEFALIMVNTEPSQIEAFFAELQNEIDYFNDNKSTLFKIKMSKGYAFNTSSLGRMEELFIKADNNMYNEKNIKRSTPMVK